MSRAGLLLSLSVSLLVPACACGTSDTADGGTSPRPDAPRDAGPRPDAGPLTLGDHPRILVPEGSARRATLEARLAAGGAAATRWRETVDLAVGGADVYAFRASDAALLSVLTGDASYCTWAVAEVDGIVAAEEALIAAGDRPAVAGDSYLEVGDYVGTVAMTYDWCFSALTAAQRDRWIAYANQAVWNVWHPSEAEWNGVVMEWSGWSIENPVNNYYYSFLEATMLLGLATWGENDLAADWLVQFHTTKIEGELVPTFERDLVGGGSREGTGYGTAMGRLFRLYDLWETTTGERIADRTSHTLASLAYLVHATTPTLDRLAPTGDHARDSSAALFDYHRAYALTIMSLFSDDPLAAVGRSYVDDCSVPEMSQRFMTLVDFLYAPDDITAAPLAGLSTVYYAEGTGHLFARSGWTDADSYLALQAGPYTESHAHHDQGAFVLFRGEWLAFDENVLSHSGIVQREDVHNLVRLERGGEVVEQRYGESADLEALEVDGDAVFFSLDAAPVYADDTITQVHRRILYVRPDVVVVEDRVTTTDATTEAVWGMSTPLEPTVAGSTATMTGTEGALSLRVLVPAAATLDVTDWAMADADMNGGYRIDVRAPAGTSARFVAVLGLDGAVTAATATTASDGITVAVTTAAGALSVTFPDTGVGATATIGASAVTFEGTVEAQPLFAP